MYLMVSVTHAIPTESQLDNFLYRQTEIQTARQRDKGRHVLRNGHSELIAYGCGELEKFRSCFDAHSVSSRVLVSGAAEAISIKPCANPGASNVRTAAIKITPEHVPGQLNAGTADRLAREDGTTPEQS